MVGRIVSDPEINETESKNKITTIIIAIQRNMKNAKGEYDSDFINCILYNGIAQSTYEYYKKGDLIGIKGRLQSNEDKNINVIAEKVVFLSSHNREEKEEE